MKTILKISSILALILVGIFLVIQVVPYDKSTSNPPVVQEPQWSNPEVRQLAVRACFDCHSNETQWPWYSRIAPVSWLVTNDVQEGRRVLNFSDWNRPQHESDDIAEVIYEGVMPPSYYIFLHPDANLSQTDKQALIKGLSTLHGLKGGGEKD